MRRPLYQRRMIMLWNSIAFRAVVLATLINVGLVAAIYAPHDSAQEQTAKNAEKDRIGPAVGAKTPEERTADYTYWLTIYTFVLAVSTVGLWVVTWRAARGQSRDMRASIEAARRSAEAAVNAINSDRAWVTPDGFNCGFSTDITIDDTRYAEGFMINLNWKNTGRSPAVRMRTYSDFAVANVDDPVPTFEIRRDTGDTKHHILGPGDRAYTEWKAVPTEVYERVKQRKAAMYMFSVVEYISAIGDGQTKTTEICARVDVIGDRMDEHGRRVPLAGLLSIGKQNSAT